MRRELEVLSIQPFFGGSHRAFMEGWIAASRHRWTLLTLPDRYWKWRMRHSAVFMAERVAELWASGIRWDAIFVSDMLNLAEFRGLVPSRIREIPTIAYFHENQLAYPTDGNSRDLHFSFTNLTTTIAADYVWFNSVYNRDSMIQLLGQASKKWPDYAPTKAIDQIGDKSSVEYPGIDIQPIKPVRIKDSPIHLIWAARWEHDKNPTDLLVTLNELDSAGVDFRVSVIGQVFHKIPPSIEQLKGRFETQIVDWGFMPDREAYWNALKTADVFISTAIHEFFGLSVSEAASVGLYMLLPDRLSYPELLNVRKFPEWGTNYLYDGSPQDLVRKISRLAKSTVLSRMEPCHELADYFVSTYGWDTRASQMDDRLQNCASSHPA